MSKIVLKWSKFMRLKNIYTICKENYSNMESLKIDFVNNTSGYRVEYWNDYTKICYKLQQIPIFKDLVNMLFNRINSIVNDQDSFLVSSSIRDFIIHNNETILEKMKCIIELYEGMAISDNTDIGFDIKMPKTDCFSEYVSNLKDLDFIISQCPLLKNDDGEIKFEGVDVGSTWLIFGIAGVTLVILKSIAILLDKTIVLKSHLTSIKQQEEILTTMRKKNQLLEEETKIFRELKDYYINNAVDELEQECDYKFKDGEEKDKTKKSMEKLIVLLDKGMEIYTSIDAPEEIQVLFSELNNELLLSEKTIKLIGDTKERE